MPFSPSNVYIDRKLYDEICKLDKNHIKRKWITLMKKTLLGNPLAGEQIHSRMIPRHYSDTHKVNNLFRFSLPEGYRGIYTLIEFEGEGVNPVILDVFSHKEYEKRFGYSRV